MAGTRTTACKRCAAVGRFLAIGVVVAGCANRRQHTITVWASSDHEDTTWQPSTDDAIYDAATGTVNLEGAVNEVTDFKVVFSADGITDVQVDDFTSPDGKSIADNVTIYRMHGVQLDRWPGWHIRYHAPNRRASRVPDVLVPAAAPYGGLPVLARPDQPVELWVDVAIPRSTVPDQYVSTLHVRDGRQSTKLELRLRVLPFVLPDHCDPQVIADVDQGALLRHQSTEGVRRRGSSRILQSDPRHAEIEELLESCMRLLRAHRLTPQLPYLYPVVEITAAGRLVVDWTDYDRVVSRYLDGSAYADQQPARCWAIPFDEQFPPPPAYGPFSSPTYSRMVREYLRQAADHFSEKGWLAQAYVTIPGSNRTDPEAREATRHFGYIVHSVDSRLRTVSELFPQDMSGYGWHGLPYEDLREYVDIWAPPAQFFDVSAISSDLESSPWCRVDRPPFSGSVAVHAPRAATLAVAWQAKVAGARAVRLATVNGWPQNDDAPAVPQACIAWEPNTIVYPGSPYGLDEPIPSLRLKRLRRSLQDVAYLDLLESVGKEHIAATIAESLIAHFGTGSYGAHCADGRPGAWLDDPRLWETARRIMADELLIGSQPTGASGAETTPQTIRWRRFMESTRFIKLDVSGVRLRSRAMRAETDVEVECIVTIDNHRRIPVEGVLRFGELPTGWTAEAEGRRVSRIDPGAVRSIALTANVAALTWNEAGVRRIPLVFDESSGAAHRLFARMCHLVAERLDTPIDIDGNLEDWPTAIGNYAADFVLICDDAGRFGTTPGGAPAHRTLCFTGTTARALLFAVRCDFDPESRSDDHPLNRLLVEDLVPLDRDCVEILLDPTNAGTRSPADLFRIVVDRHGAVWEHGVSMDPPTCPPTSWPATIRYAVRSHDDHWTAEIEVPIDAFPGGDGRPALWGLNVTRFDLARQEYATWSGATANAYDPRSLGNMTIP